MPRTIALVCLLRLTCPLLWMAFGVHCQASMVAAAAEPVWRCETADGAAALYQSTPCQGSGQALPAGRLPTPEDREASTRVAGREARLARAMGRQRAQREKNLPAAHASLSGPVRQVSVGQREGNQVKAQGRAQRRPANGATQRARQHRHDVFRAEVPGHPRKRSRSTQADAASASPP